MEKRKNSRSLLLYHDAKAVIMSMLTVITGYNKTHFENKIQNNFTSITIIHHLFDYFQYKYIILTTENLTSSDILISV